jgi:hypothetical protein
LAFSCWLLAFGFPSGEFGWRSSEICFPSNEFGLSSSEFCLPSNENGRQSTKNGWRSNRIAGVSMNLVGVQAKFVCLPMKMV